MLRIVKCLWLSLLISCTVLNCSRRQTLATGTSGSSVVYTIQELQGRRELLKNIAQEEIVVHMRTNAQLRGYFDSLQTDSIVIRLDKANSEKRAIPTRNVSFIELSMSGDGIEGHRILEIVGVGVGFGFVIFALHQLGNAR